MIGPQVDGLDQSSAFSFPAPYRRWRQGRQPTSHVLVSVRHDQGCRTRLCEDLTHVLSEFDFTARFAEVAPAGRKRTPYGPKQVVHFIIDDDLMTRVLPLL